MVTNAEVAQHSLANLLNNAIWWAKEGTAQSPCASVHLMPKGFSVSDNGPGIPEQYRNAKEGPIADETGQQRSGN